VAVKWNLGDKLDSITTDNGADFVAASKQLLADEVVEEHVRCGCHTLQRSLVTAFEKVCARHLFVSAFCTRSCTQQFLWFVVCLWSMLQVPAMLELLTLFRSVVRVIRNHNSLQQALKRKQLFPDMLHDFEVKEQADEKAVADGAPPEPQGTARKVVQEVETRWNTTHDMAERLITVRHSFLSGPPPSTPSSTPPHPHHLIHPSSPPLHPRPSSTPPHPHPLIHTPSSAPLFHAAAEAFGDVRAGARRSRAGSGPQARAG
jgi:hypothetical protein